jgi:hypothetical protein
MSSDVLEVRSVLDMLPVLLELQGAAEEAQNVGNALYGLKSE